MPKAPGQSRQRRRLSLSVRLSLLVLCAALLPLAAVVGFTNYTARATLVTQGQQSLSTDATANAKQVDRYVLERTLDGDALATLTTTQSLLACPSMPAMTQQLAQAHPELASSLPILAAVMKCDDPLYNRLSSVRALKVGIVRDSNYPIWSLYDGKMNEVISCRPKAGTDGECGTGLPDSTVTVPSADLQALKADSSKQYISTVYNDSKSGSAYINIYTPIKLSFAQIFGVLNDLIVQAAQVPDGQAALPPLPPQQLALLLHAVQSGQLLQSIQSLPTPTVGWLRSTLKLDYIWSIVGHEQGANGTGSYAFIADASGMRVADSNTGERFTTVAPSVATALKSIAAPDKPDTYTTYPFQTGATQGAKTTYQYVGTHLYIVPWTYVVLSPLPTVTQVADQQVTTSLLAAAAVAVLAVLFGLLLGRGLATPVQRSVSGLRGATEALNTLSSKQRNSASEQLWVVDACKTGLESVRYLSDAMNQASVRIVDAANWFGQYWDRLTEEQAQRTVQHLRELAQYIEEAARRQWASSDRLDKAITVTTQVSDQLANGASAAAESAQQLDAVVDELQRVVGGRVGHSADQLGAPEESEPFEHMMPAPSTPRGGFGGQPAIPDRFGQRQLAAGQMQPAAGGGRGSMNSGGGWQANPQPGPTSGGGFVGNFGQGSFGQGNFGQDGFGQGGFAQGGFGQQSNPNPNPAFGHQSGPNYGQPTAAGWPGNPSSGARGVRVWEDQ